MRYRDALSDPTPSRSVPSIVKVVECSGDHRLRHQLFELLSKLIFFLHRHTPPPGRSPSTFAVKCAKAIEPKKGRFVTFRSRHSATRLRDRRPTPWGDAMPPGWFGTRGENPRKCDFLLPRRRAFHRRRPAPEPARIRPEKPDSADSSSGG